MSRFDFSPLYRSAIGFDHLAGMIEKNSNSSTGYPPSGQTGLNCTADNKFQNKWRII